MVGSMCHWHRAAKTNAIVPVPVGLRWPSSPLSHRSRRRRSASERPPLIKSVAFDLDGESPSDLRNLPNGDGGYETDDSDSTLDERGARRSRRHRRRHRRSSSFSAPRSTAPAGRPTPSQPHVRTHRNPQPNLDDSAKEDDSESTIELPDRFDAQGRPLPDRYDEPVPGTIEDLFQNVFFGGKSPLGGGRRSWF